MHRTKNRKRIAVLAVSVLFSAARLFSQQPANGRVQGSVVDQADKPVSKASVTAQSQRGPTLQPVRVSAVTAADGSFTLTGLPAGTVTICVQVPGSALLNPCTWSSAPSIAVTAGQPATIGKIRLQAGHLLKVHLNDAAGALKNNEGKTPGAHVLIGVWAPNGLFVPARVRTRNANSRDLELPVPFGTPVRLSASSGFFTLVDENKAAVDPNKGANIPLQVSAGDAPKVYTFHVTGVKP